MSGWIDTHCHITDTIYNKDRLEVLRRLTDRQVSRCVSLGVDTASSFLARNLARCHPETVLFCAGIHPHESDKEPVESKIEELELLWNDPQCIAIGEIGLDFFRDYAEVVNQEHNFRLQLQCALKIGKPVVIHNREAADRILELLNECRFDIGGIFHCFSGDEKLARVVIDRGFYVSFAGNITYEKATLLEVAKVVPLDRWLIETDAPWLTPAPNRKQRNEPAFVAQTGEFLAKALGLSPAALQNQLADNFHQLFRK